MLNNLTAILDAGAGGAAGSFESIATVTATGSESTLSFTSIPSTYTSLQIRGISRVDTSQAVIMRFNSDSGANYARHELYGDGTTAAASGNSGSSFINVARPAISTSAANVFGAMICNIHDYASTTRNKTVRSFFGVNNNDTSTDYWVGLRSGVWLNTNAVTTISLEKLSGVFSSGSTFALYGIKGA